MNKLDTKNHFQFESEFINHYSIKTVSQVEVNRQRLISAVYDIKQGFSTKDTKTLLYKINSLRQRRNITESDETIFSKILEGDTIYHSIFMIDPKKQNGTQTGNEFIQTNYIQKKLDELDSVNIIRLPNKGPNSERIVEGKIVKGIGKSADSTKSIDCFIENPKNLKIRTINKITTSLVLETNDAGGAQSNQLELSEKGVSEIDFSLLQNQNIYILFILDGKFFINNNYVNQLIEKYKENKNVYFTTSDGIKEVIGSILHN
jgi:uncharacterized Zn ribbon protein